MSEENPEQQVPDEGDQPVDEKIEGDQFEAPEPVESSVTVEPDPAPGLLDQFKVSPERGYRRKA